MKRQEAYNAWKDKKHQIDISESFADDVMKQIYQYEQKKKMPLFDIERLVEFISVHPLLKTGFIAAGAITGIVRLIVLILIILNRGVING